MAGRQWNDASHTEKVRRDQHVSMQDMTVEDLAVKDELTQQLCLLT
jgi:hypothetical protein